MPYNPKSDIHQYTWYSWGPKKFLCTSAGWALDAATNEWLPTEIYLLEFLTCKPRLMPTPKMITLLQTGEIVVIKSPIGEKEV
jgi:hypothetical protein